MSGNHTLTGAWHAHHRPDGSRSLHAIVDACIPFSAHVVTHTHTHTHAHTHTHTHLDELTDPDALPLPVPAPPTIP